MARLRSIRGRLRRFTQLDHRSRLLLTEALCCLFAARVSLRFVPFPALARRIGMFVSRSDPRIRMVGIGARPKEALIAADVSWAVTRAARYAPFSAVCLPQAMAAHRMLRRRGVASVMHFGAVRARIKALDTHAWLDAAGVEVTGYPIEEGMEEIACFI